MTVARTTAIEWTDRTLNPIRARAQDTGRIGHYCEHVSEGCRNCYAERWQRFRGTGLRDSYQPALRRQGRLDVFLDERVLLKPLSWRQPRKVFWCDMTDLYGDWVPNDWIAKVWAVRALTPHLIHQDLTKRPERRRVLLDDPKFRWLIRYEMGRISLDAGDATLPEVLPNVWLMVSVEDQRSADERVPPLLRTPAAVRGVSYEPALGPVDFANLRDCTFNELNWIIVGGESGPKARPMHPDWACAVRDQCKAAGVKFFMKQLSGPHGRVIKNMELFPEDLRVREFPRVGA